MKTLSGQEGTQTIRRARNSQNASKRIGQGDGQQRESRATKEIIWARNDNESTSSQEGRVKSDQKGAGRLDGQDAERPGGLCVAIRTLKSQSGGPSRTGGGGGKCI